MSHAYNLWKWAFFYILQSWEVPFTCWQIYLFCSYRNYHRAPRGINNSFRELNFFAESHFEILLCARCHLLNFDYNEIDAWTVRWIMKVIRHFVWYNSCHCECVCRELFQPWWGITGSDKAMILMGLRGISPVWGVKHVRISSRFPKRCSYSITSLRGHVVARSDQKQYSLFLIKMIDSIKFYFSYCLYQSEGHESDISLESSGDKTWMFFQRRELATSHHCLIQDSKATFEVEWQPVLFWCLVS